MAGKTGLLFLCVVFLLVLSTQLAAARFNVPVIVVFGDSTVDVGNNNFLPGNESKANFPHNGIDFPGHRPTGRFSNGYNTVDYLAKKLGFKRSPPAHLSMSSKFDLYHGANLASGGSGILDATGFGVSISLNLQIKDYENLRQILRNHIGSTQAERYISESLFIFSTGNNDLLGFSTKFGLQNATQEDLFVEQLAAQFKNQLQTVYTLGARRFVVFGSSKLGCVPSVRRNVPNAECIDGMNKLSQKFNMATEKILCSLASTLKGFSYSFINVYDIISVISATPQKYGFTDLSSACCGSGRLNAETGCTPNASYCSDRNQYLFWDRVHPTQATSKLVASAAFYGRKYATPVTVEQLALDPEGY